MSEALVGVAEEGMGEWAWVGVVPCVHMPCTDAHPSWGHGVAPDTNPQGHTPDPASVPTSTAQSRVIVMTSDLRGCEGPKAMVFPVVMYGCESWDCEES